MHRVLKHLALFGMAVPTCLVGYHALASRSPGIGDASDPQVLVDAVQGFGLGDWYELSDLELVERNFYHVEHRYVEKERLDPEAMFQGALDAVERDINEVMFVREPGGRRLQVSVGAYTTVMLVEPIESFDALYGQLRRVAAVLEDHLSDEVSHPEVEYALINGALSTLDPHTLLLDPEAAREMEVDNQGEFAGLGVEISIDAEGRLVVSQPMDGTPALKAGLRADDVIVRIEDESTIGMDISDAVERLRGEVGSPVTIEVERPGTSKPLAFTIERARIEINKVEGELLEGGIGYVRIPSFHRNVSSNLDALLTRFRRDNNGQLEGLVIDLRDNPGGYLNQAFEVANKFLDDGVIVATVEGGNRRREEQRATRGGTEPSYPVAVLVNGNSASASEIVAGALRNRDRAVIIGERSFGKGSVQHLYKNKDDSALKLTVAKYLTPGDHSIQSVGIPPDIELRPSVVRPGTGDDPPVVSLYWRDLLDREADLDHHLSQMDRAPEPPTFALRYLRPERKGAAADDPARDWEVDFARRVLLTTDASRRADVLRAAEPVVLQARSAQERALVDALAAVGVDWRAGRNPSRLPVEVTLEVDGAEALVAGEAQELVVRVTNTGDAPLHRLTATTESDNPWLDQKEFTIGALAAGETRTLTERVRLHDGYGDEVSPVGLRVRDDGETAEASASARIRTRAQPQPALAYALRIVDDGSGRSRGDGDGLPEAGEIVELELTVENTGEGPTREAFARLRNRSGKALDLTRGRVRPGTDRDADGAACAEREKGCKRSLAPGERTTQRFTFTLRELPEDADGWKLALSVGDNARYDYGAVQRAGFADYFQLEETLVLRPDQAVDPAWRHAPEIQVTRAPGLEATTPHAVLSGVVQDDVSLRDVMVFLGDDKVFYQGGRSGERRLPFSVEPELEPGLNALTVLARDASGLTATWSQGVWLDGPPTTAMRAPTEDEAGP